MYQLIVFDWDGTLFDSTALITRSIQAAAVAVGLPAPSAEKARYVIGLGLSDALHFIAPQLPQTLYADLAEAYRRHYAAHMNDITLFEGVPELLRQLQLRGHQLAVATGKSRRGLNEALVASGLDRVFDATRTADETASKPHPRMLFELLDELGVHSRDAVMVGDTTHDLLMAQDAGVAAAAVTYGAHDVAALEAFKPLCVAHDVRQLHQWLLPD